jgi:hypothetical protein
MPATVPRKQRDQPLKSIGVIMLICSTVMIPVFFAPTNIQRVAEQMAWWTIFITFISLYQTMKVESNGGFKGSPLRAALLMLAVLVLPTVYLLLIAPILPMLPTWERVPYSLNPGPWAVYKTLVELPQRMFTLFSIAFLLLPLSPIKSSDSKAKRMSPFDVPVFLALILSFGILPQPLYFIPSASPWIGPWGVGAFLIAFLAMFRLTRKLSKALMDGSYGIGGQRFSEKQQTELSVAASTKTGADSVIMDDLEEKALLKDSDMPNTTTSETTGTTIDVSSQQSDLLKETM